jgi:hypothetical protein
MDDSPLGYEVATAFHRVRSERAVHGIGVAVLLAIIMYSVFALRGDRMDRLLLYAVLFLLTWFLVREAWALLRGRSAWEIRIAGDRLYLHLAGDQTEQSVELCDLQHVMVAEYGTGKQRYTKVFLLLRDGRCWEVPSELLFPRRPLLRAISRAAPHVTLLTNAQMPERDPLHDSLSPKASSQKGEPNKGEPEYR